MFDFGAPDAHLCGALEFPPFLSRQVVEQEVEHTLSANIEEVPAANVEWRTVYHHRTAQPTCLGFLLDEHERIAVCLCQRCGEGEARGAGPQYAKTNISHCESEAEAAPSFIAASLAVCAIFKNTIR